MNRSTVHPPAIGLGTGGLSRLGLMRGEPETHAIDLIRFALNQGVRYLDTAADYENESIVGQAIANTPRESIYLASKVGTKRFKRLRTKGSVRRSLKRSLKKLGTDYLDLFQFHAVRPYQYEGVRDVLLPVLQELKQEGVIRAIGITEKQSLDRSHTLMQQAVQDDRWDTVMIALSMDHPVAAEQIIPTAAERGIAVLGMCAARNLMRDPAVTEDWCQKLGVDRAGLVDRAYRYVRDTPGVASVLFSASKQEQVEANLRSLRSPEA